MLSAPLPLINQSLGDLLNIASDIATKIQAIVQSPAGAIQQLNNILMNALGLPTPSVAVANTVVSGHAQETITFTADAGTFTISFTPSSGSPQTTTPIQFSATTDMSTAIANALNKLQGVNVTVAKNGDGSYTITFVPTGTMPTFTVDSSQLARGPPASQIVKWDNANSQIDFDFDLQASIQISKPFDLDLSQLVGAGALAAIANALIGAGASGNLAVNIGATLHVALVLDLSSPATVGGSNLSQTVALNATGGSFMLTYQSPLSPPQNVTATAESGGSLTAGTHYYKVTAIGSNGETLASSEVIGGRRLDEPEDRADVGRRHRSRQLPGLHRPSGAENTYFMSNGASFTDDGTGSAIAHALPSAATATSTETTGAIAYDPNATDAVNASAAQTALTALGGLSGNVTVAFASKTYTITFAGSLGTVAPLTVDGSKLTGTQHSLYLKIGDGDGDTHLDLTASVAGTNLNFHAMIGRSAFTSRTAARASGGRSGLHLVDPGTTDHPGRFNIIGFGGGTFTSDLSSIGSFITSQSVCFTPVGSSTCGQSGAIATATLPLYIGTDSFKLAINDPILEPTNGAATPNLHVAVTFDLSQLPGNPFGFVMDDGTPGQYPWQGFSPQLPSLFALLADPSVVVDGLDQVFSAIENLIQGQIFGFKAAAPRRPAREQPVE